MAGTTAPFERVLRSVLVMPVMARLVVVAFEVVARLAVKFWRVVEPLTKRVESVARPDVLRVESEARPVAESVPNDAPPKALSCEVIVVEPVTASAVVVAPTAVSPPLKPSCVEVALPGKRYAKVS